MGGVYKIAIGAGHSPNCDGARGHGFSENHEARLICDAFEDICKNENVSCVRCDSYANNKTDYLNEQVRKFNNSGADICLQIHLNSGGGTGCEVWIKNAPWTPASNMSSEMAAVLDLRNRGVKYSYDLRILNSVKLNPYIVEVCFIDSYSDIMSLQGRHRAVAAALFAAVVGYSPEEDDVQLSDKLNDTPLPDGTFNNVGNALDRARKNSDEIIDILDDFDARLVGLSKQLNSIESLIGKNWRLIDISAPETGKVGEKISWSPVILGDKELLTYNYVWSWEGHWGDDWDSTVKRTGKMTTDEFGSFIPTKTGTYYVWIDVSDGFNDDRTDKAAVVVV